MLASRYAHEIVHAEASGRAVTLAGWSAGGVLAYETARQLHRRGHPVRSVVLVDSVLPETFETGLAADAAELDALLDEVASLDASAAGLLLRQRELGLFAGLGLTAEAVAAYHEIYGQRLLRLWRDSARGLAEYRAGRFDGPVTLLTSGEHAADLRDAQETGWREHAEDLSVHTVAGEHHQLLTIPYVEQLPPHFLR